MLSMIKASSLATLFYSTCHLFDKTEILGLFFQQKRSMQSNFLLEFKSMCYICSQPRYQAARGPNSTAGFA